jgi:hypothetical protein
VAAEFVDGGTDAPNAVWSGLGREIVAARILTSLACGRGGLSGRLDRRPVVTPGAESTTVVVFGHPAAGHVPRNRLILLALSVGRAVAAGIAGRYVCSA